MAIEITIPRLGWAMEEGTFVRWLKQDGDEVKAGELLFELESDKATQEIESLDAGILRVPADAPQPGDKVKVGQLLGYLVGEGEVAPSASGAKAPGSSGDTPPQEVDATLRQVGMSEQDLAPASVVGAPAISPRAVRVAAELGVDWAKLTGSGRTGRIREQDVRAAAAGTTTKPGLSAIRRTIADRMVNSLRNTAPVTLNTTADATRLVELRNELKAAASDSDGAVPSYTDMLVKLAALVLQRHPQLNTHWEGQSLIPSSAIHIGVAVDTESGLLVPVLRDVPALTLREIAARSRDLIARARSRKLSADELRDGTFTITNLGSFGIDAFTPIINYPECAVLGVGRIQRQPAVVAGQIVPRDILTLSLTFDHRATDGAPAARFLQTLRGLIESPAQHFTPTS